MPPTDMIGGLLVSGMLMKEIKEMFAGLSGSKLKKYEAQAAKDDAR